MSGSRVTPEIMMRGLELGLTPDRIEFLMKVADIPNYSKIDTSRPDGYEMVKPDPDGVYYLKATVSGKWIVKPLSSDEAESKKMLSKLLKSIGLK